jgi:hypothetical protein
VKLGYLPQTVRQELPRFLKLAYNAQAVEIGGRGGGGLFRQRLVPLYPTMAFNSEGSPPRDQAVLDRLIVVLWQRLSTLPTDVRKRAADGFEPLRKATADAAMAPVAAAWYAYAAGTDLRQRLTTARQTLPKQRNRLGIRQRSNLEVVLAGRFAYAEFCKTVAPGAESMLADLITSFARSGADALAAELAAWQTVTGALGVLQWLATLSQLPGPYMPVEGSHYRLSAEGVSVNVLKVLACLRQNQDAVGAPLPDEHDFLQEMKGWAGVHRQNGRERGASRDISPIAYWMVPWSTLAGMGGPDRDDFAGSARF